MKPIFRIFVFWLLASSLAQADTPTAEIKTLITQYQSALNASNVNGVLKLYSKNPTFMPQHMPAQVGRKAVKQAYEKVFKTIKLNIKFTLHNIQVLGDTAWARTSSAGKTKILANNTIVNEGNNELFIFKNENSNWKIYQYLFSTNQSRESSQPILGEQQ